MMALPSCSSVLPMSPIRMPETRIGLALAGETACAVGNSALAVNGSSSKKREAQPLVVQDVVADEARDAHEHDERDDRGEVLGVLADRALHRFGLRSRRPQVGAQQRLVEHAQLASPGS